MKLAQQTVDPIASAAGGSLPMLSYCIEISHIVNHYREVTFGAGAKIIGLSYPNAFITSDSEIAPEDVWRLLCALTGAQYGNITVGMTSRNAVNAWAPIMSEGNQVTAASGVARLAAEIIHPAGCIVKAAVDGYRRKKVISKKDHDDAYSAKIGKFPDMILTTSTSRPTVSVGSHDIVGLRRIGSPLRRKVSTVGRVTDHAQIPIPVVYTRLDTKDVIKLYDDAPLVINIAAVLNQQPSFDDAPDDTPSAGPDDTTPPTPPPAPPPTPTTPAAPPPAPPPAAPPGPSVIHIDYRVHLDDDTARPSNVPSDSRSYSPVTVKVGGLEVFGQAIGSPAQAANAVNGNYGSITLSDLQASPSEGEEAERVFNLGNVASIQKIVSAATNDVPGTHRVDLRFDEAQSVDDD
jgi:hypothetical protein